MSETVSLNQLAETDPALAARIRRQIRAEDAQRIRQAADEAQQAQSRSEVLQRLREQTPAALRLDRLMAEADDDQPGKWR